jgi:ATP-dependent Clp protease ATP-binding subunit ClpA
MFNKYTEKATRVIFFARQEPSQLGVWSIGTEHLLLGLLREDPPLVSRFLSSNDSVAAIRQHVEERTTKKAATVPTSVDLPLTDEPKLVLRRAAQEADGLSHDQIDTRHLLLGLLSEEAGLASEILRSHGFDSADIRREFGNRNSALPKSNFVPDEQTAMRIAEAIWIPVYGQEMIERQKPLRAELENDVWIVSGALPEGQTGGILVARISKTNGTILQIGQDQ